MKIQFIKSAVPFGFAYNTESILDTNKAFGKEMIELGVAIEIEEADDSNLPEDVPARDVLIKTGITSLDELHKIATIESLTAIKGIGKKLAESILNYLAEK